MENTNARLLEERHGVTFLDCLDTCIHEREFVAQWERLSGKKLLPANSLCLACFREDNKDG